MKQRVFSLFIVVALLLANSTFIHAKSGLRSREKKVLTYESQ